ncbi:beta-lactamase family protein [Chryseobacterium sp. MEBOG06]|uniref:serine hydrolase domain-containing protein n=1 Tax=Chryseobacterium sp. MEBOG06 TaxID=2879938 RepID=UPI001F21CD69|nr:serine hydrolase domain-containing protein [Chryseobacterium sp. MEBOG06]UKB85259.1 beta-lactamase family protein [Chryseobacterium sp. MEBOG06]
MKIKLLFVLVFLAHLCHAQIEGIWNGELDIQSMKLPVILKIKKEKEGYTSSLSSPKQSKEYLYSEKTAFINNELSFEIQKINASYKGTFKDNHFEGNLTQKGKSLPLNLFREVQKTTDIPYLNGKAINTKKIDSFLDYIAEENQGIGSVSIFRNGSEVYRKDFGQKQLKNVTHDKNTLYQIGSVSKLITAVMLLQLVEQNKLSLSDKLSKFYPEIPDAENITIKSMLNHTSGLGDYVGKSIENNWLFGKPVGDKAIIDVIIKDGVSFKPGQKMQYSNSAYFLLSRILEKLYNKPYNVILKENILKKANMKHTFSVLDNVQNIFKSYEFSKGNWVKVKDFDFHNCIGLGDIASTTEDMNIFINALFNGQFIDENTLKMMISDENEKIFGTGIIKMPFYNIISYGHGGDTAGTHSTVSYQPNDKLSFAITVNGKNFPHNQLFLAVLNLIYDRDYEYPVFEADKTTLPAQKK